MDFELLLNDAEMKAGLLRAAGYCIKNDFDSEAHELDALIPGFQKIFPDYDREESFDQLNEAVQYVISQNEEAFLLSFCT